MVPELSGAVPPESKSSPVRMALAIGVISVVVFGFVVSAWNVAQRKTQRAAREQAVNLNESGFAHMSKGELYDAEIAFREAIKKDPNYPYPYTNLGQLAEREQDYATAEKHYRDAIRVAPTHSAALINVGNLFYRAGQKDSAEAYFRRALNGDDPAPAANQLAAMLYDRGQYARALAVVDSALAHDPAAMVKPYLLKNKGKAVAALGDSTAARALWTEAMSLNPDDEELRALLSHQH
jgi:tetratricopeptide (TPR) repeat protein